MKGEFTPTNIDVTGQRFNIGSMNFIATEKIADGEYQMQCETPGIVGNQQLGTMIPIELSLIHIYSASGEPAVYFSHSEYMLELFKGWA